MESEQIAGPRAPRHILQEASRWYIDVPSYGAAMVVVAAAFVALASAINHGPKYPDVAEVDAAIMIDLPPAESAAAPARDLKDGPVTEAASASRAVAVPKPIEPPKPAETPQPERQAEAPPPPPTPSPEAVPERKDEAPPQPPVAPAPSVAPQEERAPAGSEAPTAGRDSQGDDGRPHASPRAITQWQKSLMVRLEVAKRAFGREARISGTVKIAFEIDTRGALVSEKIAESSGSPTLDRAATALVKKAAPFPAPPAGAAQNDMSFIVPIRFRH